MIYFRLGELWCVMTKQETSTLLFKLQFSLYSIYNVVQMSDEILRVLAIAL
jgi:hypothetical protein